MILEAKSDKNNPLRKLDEAWIQTLGVSWENNSEVELIDELYKDIICRLESFK